MPKNQVDAHGTASGSAPLSGLRTPFGRPVVPEVYSIGEPAVRRSGRPSPSPRSSMRWKPSMWPTANRPPAGMPASSAAAVATSAKRSCARKAFAPLSERMYATSGPIRCQFTTTTYSPDWMAAK